MNKITCFVMFSLIVSLGACATKPHIEYDTDKMAAIKTIAVDVPKKTTYFAHSVGGVPIPIPGVGILAAVIGGVIAGGINGAATKSNNDFDSLVKEKVGDTGLNRKFVDALEVELRAQGYQVKEIDLTQDGMPKIAVDKTGLILKGDAYAGADAIMVAPDLTGYMAPGAMNSYVRSVTAQIRIYKADTLAPIFTEKLTHLSMQDPYNYNWYSALVADLPRAVQGIDEALMGFVPDFRTALLASRGISQATNPDAIKKTN